MQNQTVQFSVWTGQRRPTGRQYASFNPGQVSPLEHAYGKTGDCPLEVTGRPVFGACRLWPVSMLSRLSRPPSSTTLMTSQPFATVAEDPSPLIDRGV